MGTVELFDFQKFDSYDFVWSEIFRPFEPLF
jgi:hypothetical protein